MVDIARLNPAQQQAILHGDTPLLVLAGAGTGKTTVITHRIAHLIEERGVPPQAILAVTFTNKAAREMRERVATLCQLPESAIEIGTFHRVCGRLLRQFGDRIGLNRNFVIYDESDQLQQIKRAMADLKLDTQAFPPKGIRYRIEQWKNQGLLPDEVQPSAFDMLERRAAEVYRVYRRHCIDANAVDFSDMLLHE